MTNTHLEELADAIEADGVVSLIEIYLEDTPRLMAELLEADKQSDIDGMRSATHTLKSSANYLGQIELSELCATMESHSRDGDIAAVRGHIPRLKELVAQSAINLDAAKAEFAARM